MLDLNRDGSTGVIRQAVILPPLEGELGLQKQVVPSYQAVGDGDRDGSADRGLIVMAALVGGIDAPEALPQGELGQALCLLLLPGGPVKEAGDSNAFDRQGPGIHQITFQLCSSRYVMHAPVIGRRAGWRDGNLWPPP